MSPCGTGFHPGRMRLPKLPARLAALTLTLAAAASCASDDQTHKAQVQAATASPTSSPAGNANPAASIRVAYRRLTESQYRHVIASTFGEGIEINARFEPEQRLD